MKNIKNKEYVARIIEYNEEINFAVMHFLDIRIPDHLYEIQSFFVFQVLA